MSKTGTLDLLLEVEENLEAMKKSKDIRPVKVKSLLEHLRSALEYVANDTYDKYVGESSTPRPNIFFPYGEQKFIDAFFVKKLNISAPVSSPLYEIYNSIQKYYSGDDWLSMMCNLTNEVKHRNPIPLEEEEYIKDIEVNFDGFGLFKADNQSKIVFQDNYFDGGKLEDFTIENGKVERHGNGKPLNIMFTHDKKIRFHGHNYEVVPFIELCHKKIKKFVESSYSELDKL